jgi:predicted dehydrogenase
MSASSSRQIRIGAIGCGQFMSQQHLQTIARSPNLVLQHLADLDEAKLERMTGRYHPVRRSTRWEDVVADAEVEVVVAGVWPEFHPQIARAAIERGKPIYVEKPLAPTPEECQLLQRLADGRGVPVAVGFNRRFAPATELLKRAFRSVASPVTAYYRIADDDRVRPADQRWKNADRLLTEAVHIFDLLAYLLDSEPVRVDARETRPNDALVLIDYAGGSHAAILCSSYGSLAQPKEHLEAILDRGAVEMDDFVEVRTYGLADLPPVTRFAGRPYDGCDSRHVEDFARRGLAALTEMRARYATALRESGVLNDNSDSDLWNNVRLGDPPLPQINYASDKGWGQALESFCLAAMSGQRSANASAADGNRATACAAAARRSLESGHSVAIDPAAWREPLTSVPPRIA